MNNRAFWKIKNNLESYGKMKTIKPYSSRVVQNEDKIKNILEYFQTNMCKASN